MGGSRAGVRARRGQEPRPDWGAPLFMGVVGAGVRRLLREEGASAIVRKRQEAGGGGPWSLSGRNGGGGTQTASVYVGVGVRNP